MACGVIGIWMVPGVWLSAVIMRVGAGPVAWLATRIATTLAWYALVGPVIHKLGRGAQVTTGGVLTATAAATAAVSLGVGIGLLRRPARPCLRIPAAALIGAGCTQAAISVVMRVWPHGINYEHVRRLDWLIVVSCALVVCIGAISRPKLPPMTTARNFCKLSVALAVIVVTAAVLIATAAKWSPNQRMPSAFGAEQVTAPAGTDVAIALTVIGPDGPRVIEHAQFAAFDDTGHPVPVDTRLVSADDAAGGATLLLRLNRSSQALLCQGAGPDMPVKLTLRDKASGVLVQAVMPDGWCVE
jgi:hypothetical protein